MSITRNPAKVMRLMAGTDIWVELTTTCDCTHPDPPCECPVTCLRCWSTFWDDPEATQPKETT